MSKKLFSFRLEEDKIEKVKAKAKALRTSTQALLEQLVDLALSDAITLDNNTITLSDNSFDNEVITELKKLITDNNEAIKLLSDKVTKLESYQNDNDTIAFKEQLSSNTNQDDNNSITTEREPKQKLIDNQDDSNLITVESKPKQNLIGSQDDNSLITDKEASTEVEDDLEPVEENNKPSESLESVTDDDKQNTEIKSYEEAKIKIKELTEAGKNYSQIAKELTGEYCTSTGKTNWQGTQVKRVLKEN